MNHPLQAVLWDMDGTLVDTEPSWIAAEYRLVESFGGSWTNEHAHAIVGQPLLVSAAYIREHGQVPLSPPDIVDRLLHEVLIDVRQRLSWRPGIKRLLAETRQADVPMAMVTMSYRSLAEAVASQLPEDTFDTLVCGDEVSVGKPDPQCYLLAAERLGVDPEYCVAIEDSPAGIAAAEAAGCVVVAVPNQVPVAEAWTRTIMPDLTSVTLADFVALVGKRTAA